MKTNIVDRSIQIANVVNSHQTQSHTRNIGPVKPGHPALSHHLFKEHLFIFEQPRPYSCPLSPNTSLRTLRTKIQYTPCINVKCKSYKAFRGFEETDRRLTSDKFLDLLNTIVSILPKSFSPNYASELS